MAAVGVKDLVAKVDLGLPALEGIASAQIVGTRLHTKRESLALRRSVKSAARR